MEAKIIFYWFLSGFVIGFGIGYFISWPIELIEPSNKTGVNLRKNSPLNLVETSIADLKKIRILCAVSTMPESHSKRAVHVMETWGKHCDKILFFSTKTDGNIGAIGFNVTDGHEYIWGRVKFMMQHIYKNFLLEYDWFIKCDDDTFLITENLRYMLSAYSTDDPIYFGYKFNTTAHRRGYFSGGAGYVMSRKTVRTFVEKVLTNKEFYRKSVKVPGCHIKIDTYNEDWEMGLCLDYYNVYHGDSRDLLKRNRFVVFTPELNLLAGSYIPNWYWKRSYYFDDEGLDCCSNYTISFHFIRAKYQYSLYFLTYRLNVFGVEKRFPLPPMKKNFSQVADLLEQESVNDSLRGY